MSDVDKTRVLIKDTGSEFDGQVVEMDSGFIGAAIERSNSVNHLREIYVGGDPQDDVTHLLQPEEILAVHIVEASQGAYRSGMVARWMVGEIMNTNWSAMHQAFRDYRDNARLSRQAD